MSSARCAVRNCFAKMLVKRTMHRFPLGDPPRAREWSRFCDRDKDGEEEWVPSTSSRICEYHFDADQFKVAAAADRRFTRLKNKAVPSVSTDVFPMLPVDQLPYLPDDVKLVKTTKIAAKSAKALKRKLKRSKPPPNMDTLAQRRLAHLIGRERGRRKRQNMEKTSSNVFGPNPDHSDYAAAEGAEAAAAAAESFPEEALDWNNVMYIDVTTPSPTATVFLNSTPADLHNLKLQLKSVKKENERLRLKCVELTRQLRKVNADDDRKPRHRDILEFVFRPDQIRYLRNNVARAMKGGDPMPSGHRGAQWDRETLKLAAETRAACGTNGYCFLRSKNYPLPAVRTLARDNFYAPPGKGYKHKAMEDDGGGLPPWLRPDKPVRFAPPKVTMEQSELCDALMEVVDEPDSDEEEEEEHKERLRRRRVAGFRREPEAVVDRSKCGEEALDALNDILHDISQTTGQGDPAMTVIYDDAAAKSRVALPFEDEQVPHVTLRFGNVEDDDDDEF